VPAALRLLILYCLFPMTLAPALRALVAHSAPRGGDRAGTL